MDVNLSKLWEIAEDRGVWRVAVHGVTKSWTRLRDSTTTEKMIKVPWRENMRDCVPGSLPREQRPGPRPWIVFLVQRPSYNVPGQLFAAFHLLVLLGLQILVLALFIPEGEIYLGHALSFWSRPRQGRVHDKHSQNPLEPSNNFQVGKWGILKPPRNRVSSLLSFFVVHIKRGESQTYECFHFQLFVFVYW